MLVAVGPCRLPVSLRKVEKRRGRQLVRFQIFLGGVADGGEFVLDIGSRALRRAEVSRFCGCGARDDLLGLTVLETGSLVGPVSVAGLAAVHVGMGARFGAFWRCWRRSRLSWWADAVIGPRSCARPRLPFCSGDFRRSRPKPGRCCRISSGWVLALHGRRLCCLVRALSVVYCPADVGEVIERALSRARSHRKKLADKQPMR